MTRRRPGCAEACMMAYLRALYDPRAVVVPDRVPAQTFVSADWTVPVNEYTRKEGIAGGRVLAASCRAPSSAEDDCSCHVVVDVGGQCKGCASRPTRCLRPKAARFVAARAYDVAGRWEDWMAGRYGRRF